MTDDYPGLIPKAKPRSAKEWSEWWEGFRRRHGLNLPTPPADAPPPPKPHNETDRDEETER